MIWVKYLYIIIILISILKTTSAFSLVQMQLNEVASTTAPTLPKKGNVYNNNNDKRKNNNSLLNKKFQQRNIQRIAKSFSGGKNEGAIIINDQISVLNELSKEGTKESASRAYEILKSLEASVKPSQSLNVVHYALVINSFANIGDVKSARKILNGLIEKYSSTTNSNSLHENKSDNLIFPNSHCFSGVIKAYIREFTMMNQDGQISMIPSLGQKCEEIILQMSKFYKLTGNVDVQPNTVVYNLLLKAYTEVAVSIISQKNVTNRNTFRISYNAKKKINNVEGQNMKEIVQKASDILSKMETGFVNEHGVKYPEPDSYSYCTIISLLAKSTDVQNAKLAESYLEKTTQCDTASYNAVLLAWSKIGTRYAAERATSLLEKLESEGTPNNTSYNTVISAWVKSKNEGENRYAAEKAELILRKIEENPNVQPNVIAYSSIIDCWSKSGSLDGAKRAQKLLDRMEDLYSTGENFSVRPNVITYTSVVSAYARTSTVEGAVNANDLLVRMKRLYNESKEEDVKPNVVTYFAVIDGWARSTSPHAGVCAEKLLLELENLYREGDKTMQPDVRIYARVIAAHVKCGQMVNFDSAEKIINRMELYAESGIESHATAKPNVVIYNTLISEYARKRYSKRALKVLNQMDRYNSAVKTESDKVPADENTLNGIIYALSTGTATGNARKALKILERLENSHVDESWDVKPSTRSYNMVINACANSFKGSEKERLEAFSIAMNVYAKLMTSHHASVDRFTFISLFKACGKLLPTKSELRRKHVMDIFMSCCNEGLVDDDIFANFLLAAKSFELPVSISSFLDNGNETKMNASLLPSEWTYKAKT